LTGRDKKTTPQRIASERPEVLMQNLPLDWGELPAWLDGLTFEQVDHVWVAAIADLYSREAPPLGALLHVLRYVRSRCHAEVLRVARHPDAAAVEHSLGALTRLRACEQLDPKHRRGISDSLRARPAGNQDVEPGIGDPPPPAENAA